MPTLENLGEFKLIDRIAARAAGLGSPEIVVGIGDDAAVLRPRRGEDLVVSTDALIENTHFRWDNQSPATIGRRALLVNLSDLAAMGARPVGFTIALSAPGNLSVARIDSFLTGLLREARNYACPLVGGNLSGARETCLAVTVFGAVKRGKALLRGSARPGDRLFVTGTLGGAALALARSRRRGAKLSHLPTPRVAAGRALAQMKQAAACIDLSDGFVADLEHVLEASGVGAVIDATRIPLPRGFAAACSKQKLDPLHTALRSGEDYELLFTLRPDKSKRMSEAALSKRLGVGVREVGRITATPGIEGLPPGFDSKSSPQGYRHF
jgi:thiamine-monophosphate kinase